ncbi:MAG TPA: bifunctional diguanylate cyclase/phosphodiesterase [Solirubrobacteraceae bacterium]|nr:bifunctional diguanylate cyclase/phosphodiesterase [Solirubrobacteraceae bacterium]
MSWDAIADNARLSALRELGIIDTDPEAEFDRFTALAAELLKAPVSTITLIDSDRQFWKSAYGITGSWAEARGTPLSHSLCQEPMTTGTPLVLSDLRADRERADCLALRDLDVVAYAGMPLVLADGFAVGALCVIDHEPHEWTERDLATLSSLAEMVSSMLDLRRGLNQQMLHDPLTGLPNRALTVSYGETLSGAEDTGDLLALAIGIDRLGSLSGVHGVMHGDHLINLLARRIAHQLSIEDVLGRLQNDVFAVLRPRLMDHAEALDLAHRIRGAVCSDPITFHGEPMEVSATVGMAIAGPGIDGDTLIGRALSSLERARIQEEDVVTFVPRTEEETPVRSRVRGALAGAVQRGEIFVNFQPIVELTTGETAGYEALARWRHPELGLIGPSEFIPLAEATGDIVIIGEHVLRAACAQLAIWRSMVPGDDLGVTVNISPLQLAAPGVAKMVRSVLEGAGLPGSALTLEITEKIFVSPGPVQRANLEEIRGLGVHVALDDFGTGYSALSYLKHFPVDMIKVDRCFLDGLETDRRDAALMRAILSIGSGMDLEVVAEGVETRAQRELLRLSGCQWGQGFLFSEPLPADQINLHAAPSVFGAPAGPVVDGIVAAPEP